MNTNIPKKTIYHFGMDKTINRIIMIEPKLWAIYINYLPLCHYMFHKYYPFSGLSGTLLIWTNQADGKEMIIWALDLIWNEWSSALNDSFLAWNLVKWINWNRRMEFVPLSFCLFLCFHYHLVRAQDTLMKSLHNQRVK